MPTKTTRATTRRPTRRPTRKPLLVRVARASLTRYDRRVIGIVTTRFYRAVDATTRRLHLTPVRARTLRVVSLLVLVVVVLVWVAPR